jgi:hypothetical protein
VYDAVSAPEVIHNTAFSAVLGSRSGLFFGGKYDSPRTAGFQPKY